MMMDDNDGQMIFGDLGGLKLPDICLTGKEKSRKNLTQETCPDRGSNPGLLREVMTLPLGHNSVPKNRVSKLMMTYIVVFDIYTALGH